MWGGLDWAKLNFGGRVLFAALLTYPCSLGSRLTRSRRLEHPRRVVGAGFLRRLTKCVNFSLFSWVIEQRWFINNISSKITQNKQSINRLYHNCERTPSKVINKWSTTQVVLSIMQLPFATYIPSLSASDKYLRKFIKLHRTAYVYIPTN